MNTKSLLDPVFHALKRNVAAFNDEITPLIAAVATEPDAHKRGQILDVLLELTEAAKNEYCAIVEIINKRMQFIDSNIDNTVGINSKMLLLAVSQYLLSRNCDISELLSRDSDLIDLLDRNLEKDESNFNISIKHQQWDLALCICKKYYKSNPSRTDLLLRMNLLNYFHIKSESWKDSPEEAFKLLCQYREAMKPFRESETLMRNAVSLTLRHFTSPERPVEILDARTDPRIPVDEQTCKDWFKKATSYDSLASITTIINAGILCYCTDQCALNKESDCPVCRIGPEKVYLDAQKPQHEDNLPRDLVLSPLGSAFSLSLAKSRKQNIDQSLVNNAYESEDFVYEPSNGEPVRVSALENIFTM